jgi:capsular polysaccharide biosynthesis protein
VLAPREVRAGGDKVFISREKAKWRRLVNEKECLRMLQRLGFQRRFMEELSFEDQIGAMRQASVLVAVHGTGLANMMFMPQGAHVVEISSAAFPNPQFYALAVSLELNYWLVMGRSEGRRPAHDDIWVDLAELEDVVGRVVREVQRAGGRG